MNDVLQMIYDNYTGSERETLVRAYRYAEEAHSGQKRASGEAYFIHPCAVAKILMELGLDCATVAAAFLHDVIEDTPVTEEDIRREFGDEILRLVSGVTTARCLGDRFYIDVTCKKAQKEGRIAGPKLVVSGIGMRASHGHGYVGMPFNGPEEFRKAARENIAHGVDFLKVFMTKVINATPFIYHFMSPEELRAVVQEARSVGITTACHCSGGQGLDDCLEAGIDCLEHVYYITPKQVDAVREADRWVVYTPSYALNDELLFKFSPKDREGSLKEKEIICKCLSGAIEGGLKFGIGTDGIHQGLAQEAAYIAMLGASNKLVLAGITINAARLCRVDDKTGSITEGKAADMVALDGNPLEDVSALKRVKAVFQDGKKICLA